MSDAVTITMIVVAGFVSMTAIICLTCYFTMRGGGRW